ncbi:MAG: N-6 DNA methylase [Candidatus Odinarchaeia archaeon]
MSLYPLEASVRHHINTQLENLGWNLNESSPDFDVTQERAKTLEQNKKLRGKRPDYILYEKGTNKAIGVIEAKRTGQNLEAALKKSIDNYARPLDIPLIFAYNDTFVETRFLYNNRPLRIDGEDVKQLIDHYTALRFVHEGSEILSASPEINYSREQLIKIFKKTSNLLREAGLQAGLERFGVFSDILFLKLMDEASELKIHQGKPSLLADHLRWENFKNKSKAELHLYMKDVVWPAMSKKYKEIFGKEFLIESPEILSDIITQLSELNLTAADTDIKGDAFEYFLKNAYQGVNLKDLGEYFTPRNIVRIMVSMVNPKIGESIYDPFAGTGGFLIESFKYISLRTKLNKKTEEILKNETVYGSEITNNARIAKMNMLLFGDGHSNLVKEDSFAHPKKGKFDIVLTNPPYSQKTRYGHLYNIPTTNGDAIAVMHIFDSLNDNGKACFLVKEDFLSEKGVKGTIREYIFKNAKNFTVISLPRKMFEPYTPTKTSIVYFEKNGKRNTTFFFIAKNVGHKLTGRKKIINKNDLPYILDSFNEEKIADLIRGDIVKNENIKDNNYSLWFYDYFEEIPKTTHKLDFLGEYIKERDETVMPQKYPNKEFGILGVNNIDGIFFNETVLGENIKQKYKRVYAGDLVYNPHRVNVGSIGIVPEELDGKYVSSIYIIFYSKDKKIIPPEFIHTLLKTPTYLEIIKAYDTKYGAVRANLTYEMLCKIKIPVLSPEEIKGFIGIQNNVRQSKQNFRKEKEKMKEYLTSFINSRAG